MRNRTVLLLSVLCLGLLFAQANTVDDRINSIIAKHAARWRTKMTHQDDSAVKQAITGHKCIQDTVINPLMEKTKEKLHSFSVQKNLSPKQKQMEKKAEDYQNMRFYVYENKIFNGSSDPNRACYNSGSSVCLVDWDSNGNFQCDSYVCESVDVLTNNLQTFLRQSVMPTLTEIFTEVIQVPVNNDNLVLDADTWEGLGGVCYPSDVAIPQSFTTTGVEDADFAIFVTARPCGDDGTVAYAAACNYEVKDFNTFQVGRPLAGIINFCPRYFQQFVSGSYSDFEYQGAVKVAVHELTHALGFSSWMYDSYVNENGDYYSEPVDTFTRSGTSAAGDSFSVSITSLKTPNLMGFARDHYGCSGLDGVELENIGGAGTAGSHWELRVAGDEYMCGYINPSMPVSSLTLSLFDDMGWYKTNKDESQFWAWGKDQGCDFLEDRCENSWPAADEGYWCDSDSATYQCTPDHKAKGQCRILTYSSNLPAYYQHFTNRRFGGANQPADLCPFYEADFDGSNYCVDTSHTGSSSLLEEYSSSSACFELIQDSTEAETPVCYSYNCESETSLTVTIDGTTFDCPTDGGEISVDSVLSGRSLSCPPASILCRNVKGGASSASTLSASILLLVVILAALF